MLDKLSHLWYYWMSCYETVTTIFFISEGKRLAQKNLNWFQILSTPTILLSSKWNKGCILKRIQFKRVENAHVKSYFKWAPALPMVNHFGWVRQQLHLPFRLTIEMSAVVWQLILLKVIFPHELGSSFPWHVEDSIHLWAWVILTEELKASCLYAKWKTLMLWGEKSQIYLFPLKNVHSTRSFRFSFF
jgi:hypothetical protein